MKWATLCYVRHAGKTLMMYRNKKPGDMHRGKWNALGGKIQPGETPEECVRREVYEEAGLHLNDLTWKGLLTFPAFDGNEDWYAFVFTATPTENAPLPDSPEGELRWVEDEHLLDLNLWEGDRLFIPWLQRPGFFSAKFIYQEGRLVDYQVTFYP